MRIAAKRERHNNGKQQYRPARQGKHQYILALSSDAVTGIHIRRAHTSKARQQPQQQWRANQRRHRTSGNFHPYAGQPQNDLVGEPEDQRTNQRGQHQTRQQTTRAEHFRQQRCKQANKADNPNRVNQ